MDDAPGAADEGDAPAGRSTDRGVPTAGTADDGGREPARSDRPPWSPELQLTVVEYDGRPDRATVHPRGLTGVDRMGTWLSADRSSFVDLSARR